MPKNLPPADEWEIHAVTQEMKGPWRHLRGKAEILGSDMLFRADEIDYNEQTGGVEARGNVYFRHFERNEQVWADRLEYNVDEQKGKFYNVRGMGQVRIDARPGVLTTNNPFYFQGDWAERIGARYILHDGFITNCRMPRPWWRLRGPRFEIIPGERATARNSLFVLRKVPLFYMPFLYKSLEEAPRRSGFLMPNLGNSSRRGKMIGIGYYWAINRSYDATYRVQEFTQRGLAHHIDFRGKPREGTDFDAIIYGVQDRGELLTNGTRRKEGGLTLNIGGQSELGHGFVARGVVNYITTLRFRQAFSESFNEAVFSEVKSVGFVNKNWSSYVFNVIVSRTEGFQRPEVEFTDPVTGRMILQPDSVVIRKLPEVTLSSRDRQVVKGPLPVWVSFEGSAGAYHRSQAVFQNDVLVERYTTGEFMNRFDFEPRLTTALRWKDWSLLPSFAVRQTYYGQSQTPYQDRFRVAGENLSRTTLDISADLVAPSLARVFDQKTWLGDQVKHVIEPRASLRYVSGFEDFEQVIRLDPVDLITNARYAEVSLNNRLFSKRAGYVSEVFSWSLAQRRYFDRDFGGAVVAGRRNVVLSAVDLTPYAFMDGPRSQSPIVSVLRGTPRPGFGFEWRADYDPVRGGIVNSALIADTRISNLYISAGHSQVHSGSVLSPSANQFRGSVGYGHGNRRGWSAGFTATYDYRQAVMQHAITQVTYNTDCCGVSVQHIRFGFGGRNESQVRLAFAVANIGSFGTLKKQERLF
ncbi:MAG TPA: LPS assembly protein LptD [Bryobacteraceae bacterium]|nr:LPS assembly protein LptD [Bryobacteraceae bacterium]